MPRLVMERADEADEWNGKRRQKLLKDVTIKGEVAIAFKSNFRGADALFSLRCP